MAGKKTIVIVDDHALFREGLKAIICRNPSYEVVGEAARGDEALETARTLKPHLVLVDISLPDQNGIDLTQQLRKSLPRTRVMIVSMHSKVDYIVNAFRAGATGFVTKESAPERLLQAIDLVLKGEYFMDSAVAQTVVQKLAGIASDQRQLRDPGYEALTAREQEILALLAEGQALKAIGDRLCISPKTVENHRTSIMRKLGLHTHFELIRYAAKVGIIDIDRWKE
ncbi:MAG: response regulator transcription factor [Desulfobacterales bacterium]|jgi:DNA-binding NarL/FixJ family response regulator|nr:response regulator transcription factor [Desulfobacterales bacterium]